MPSGPPPDVTRLLHEWAHGDVQALPRLMEAVYPELHRIAARHLARERNGHTLQPEALVVRGRGQRGGQHLGGHAALELGGRRI